ncbi:MAG: anti-sigma factor [Alphaproteobacteria bacterium]|nr:anti-sigma factor [Alphaproteobacteria bacterium]
MSEHDDIDVLASEYVLGLMSDADVADFEIRVSSDADTRRAVAGARERLLELDLTAPATPPREGLWDRIEEELDKPRPQIVNLSQRRLAAGATQSRQQRRSSFWSGFAAAAVAAILATSLAYVYLKPLQPRFIIVLLDDQAKPVSLVEAFEGQKIRVIPLDGVVVPSGKTLQVWTLPNKETGPVSMGIMDEAVEITLQGPSLPAPKPDQLYEITIEPEGGSPTGKPTGPILGKGFARMPQI